MLLRSQHDIFIFISMYLKLKTISDVLVAANRGIRVDINHARSDEDLQVSTVHIHPHTDWGVLPRRLTWVAHKILIYGNFVTCKLCKWALQWTGGWLCPAVSVTPGGRGAACGWSPGLWSVSLMSVPAQTNDRHWAQTPRGVTTTIHGWDAAKYWWKIGSCLKCLHFISSESLSRL